MEAVQAGNSAEIPVEEVAGIMETEGIEATLEEQAGQGLPEWPQGRGEEEEEDRGENQRRGDGVLQESGVNEEVGEPESGEDVRMQHSDFDAQHALGQAAGGDGEEEEEGQLHGAPGNVTFPVLSISCRVGTATVLIPCMIG